MSAEIPNNWKDDDKIVVAWRRADAKDVHPDAVLAECEICGEDVWAAPTSVAKTRAADWHLVCRPCAFELMNWNTVVIAGTVTPENMRPWEKN